MGKGDRKRGRPRKEGARTASGRLSRAQPADLETLDRVSWEQDPRQTVLQARLRHLGHRCDGPISKAEAERMQLMHRGTPLAQWRCDGAITPEQHEAGEAYAQARARYRATSGLPAEHPAGAAYGAVRGGSGDPDSETARQARESYRALSGVLDACGVAVRQAVDRAAIHEQRAPLHLVRIGLAALVRRKTG